jgi:hypothetical protein
VPSTVSGRGSHTSLNFSDGDIVPQSPAESKTRNQAREELPEDRELLLEAASRPGAGPALEIYRRKAEAMEASRRKLERRRAALEQVREERTAAGSGDPSLRGEAPIGPAGHSR